jgi:hypothetical protein
MRLAARPTRYRGIRMRSRLEASASAFLDRLGLDWTYEPECFADGDDQYLPDFGVKGVHVRGIPDCRLYLEVKPPSLGDDQIGRVLTGMHPIWASEPTAFLGLMRPGSADYTDDQGREWGTYPEQVEFPYRWLSPSGEMTMALDAVWVTCERCHHVGIESLGYWERAFQVGPHPPWRCPVCGHVGFEYAPAWTGRSVTPSTSHEHA